MAENCAASGNHSPPTSAWSPANAPFATNADRRQLRWPRIQVTIEVRYRLNDRFFGRIGVDW
jgi:hypothetical protein